MYKCLSIFLSSRYFLNKRLRTRCLLIHNTPWGIRALAVPFLLPGPVWRPLRLAFNCSLTRNLEWIVCGFLIIKPSFMSLRTSCPIKLLNWRIFVKKKDNFFFFDWLSERNREKNLIKKKKKNWMIFFIWIAIHIIQIKLDQILFRSI